MAGKQVTPTVGTDKQDVNVIRGQLEYKILIITNKKTGRCSACFWFSDGMDIGPSETMDETFLPAIALHTVKLAAVAFGWASVRISGTDAAGLVELFLSFAFGSRFHVFFVE